MTRNLFGNECPYCHRNNFPNRNAMKQHIYRERHKSHSSRSTGSSSSQPLKEPLRDENPLSKEIAYEPKETFEANGKVYDLDEVGLIWSVLDKLKKPSRSEKSETVSSEPKSVFQPSMTWACEFCYAQFSSEESAVKHEKTCFERPKSISQEEEKPQSDLLIKWAQTLLGKRKKNKEDRPFIDSAEYFSSRC
jgi:hypothetical protein